MFQPPEWQWAQAGEVGWWIRGPWQETLLDENGLRLEQWRKEGRLETVKSGPHRIVYRVDLPEGTIYVKHYLVPDYRAMFRQWFRRGKGRNEGKRSAVLDFDRHPDHLPHRTGRAAAAAASVRELPDHLGNSGNHSARRVSRAAA